MASGDTKTQQYLDIAARGTRADLQRGCCNTRTQDLIMDVAERIITEEETRYREDQILQSEIDEIKNNPDVYDIVATYADLQNYDTSTITDKDVIRVLRDETHDNASTYYRWDAADQEFDYIGETGDYYTKAQVNALLALKADKATTYTKTETDALLDGKQDALTAGENITIAEESGALVISAEGSTYTAGEAIDITNDVISATNTGKARVLTTDDYNWPTENPTSIAMWLLPDGLYANPNGLTIKTSNSSELFSTDKTFIVGSYSNGRYYLLFTNANAGANKYTIVYGSTSQVYSDTWYVLTKTNVVDNLTSTSTGAPLSANQGKVLKDLVDSLAIRAAGAPTTATVGQVGTIYEDTTNGDLYVCTDATNPYVWEAVGGGGGPTVVQTTGTSTTDVMSQNAVTSMVFADPSTKTRIQIGDGANVSKLGPVAIGAGATVHHNNSIAIGRSATAGADSTVALGAGSLPSTKGEVSIGDDLWQAVGYNSSRYRLLTGLYDPQSDHDAATKGYVDTAVAALEARIAALEGN